MLSCVWCWPCCCLSFYLFSFHTLVYFHPGIYLHWSCCWFSSKKKCYVCTRYLLLPMLLPFFFFFLLSAAPFEAVSTLTYEGCRRPFSGKHSENCIRISAAPACFSWVYISVLFLWVVALDFVQLKPAATSDLRAFYRRNRNQCLAFS